MVVLPSSAPPPSSGGSVVGGPAVDPAWPQTVPPSAADSAGSQRTPSSRVGLGACAARCHARARLCHPRGVSAANAQPGDTVIVSGVQRARTGAKVEPKEVEMASFTTTALREAAEAKEIYRNPADLIPSDHRYFTYRGSFTTPPCTEGIQWIVMKSPIVIRPEVLTAFKRAIGRNNRPIQNHNDRNIRSTLSQERDSP